MLHRFPIFTLPFLFAGSVFAHGPVARQASVAVQKVTDIFLKEESAETQAKFGAISATNIGDETFSVRIQLKNETTAFVYECGLDKTAKPVKWGCKKK